jgi:hypothetical protein
MGNILNFSLFEDIKNDEIAASFSEFDEALKNSKFKKILDSWVKFEKKKTGRIYVKGSKLPSIAYFLKTGDQNDSWYSTYVANGEDYGSRHGSLDDLFVCLLKDFIIKGLPRGTRKKEALEVIDSDGWLEKNLDPSFDKTLESLKKSIFGDVNNLDSLNNLMTPLMKRLVKSNLIHISNRGTGSIYISLDDAALSHIMLVVSDSAGTRFSRMWMELHPSRNSGIKSQVDSRKISVTVYVGVEKIEDCYERIDKYIRKYLFDIVAKPIYGKYDEGEESKFYTGLLKYILENAEKSMFNESNVLEMIADYCKSDIDKISKIYNSETREKIIKKVGLGKFDKLIDLSADGLLF